MLAMIKRKFHSSRFLSLQIQNVFNSSSVKINQEIKISSPFSSVPFDHDRRCYHDRIDKLLGHTLYKDRNHPIYNFLFIYFDFKISKLFTYSPGMIKIRMMNCNNQHDVNSNNDPCVEKVDSDNRLGSMKYTLSRIPYPNEITSKRKMEFQNILKILKTSYSKYPHYACFGLHEWAMLYRPSKDHLKHQTLPLRISQQSLDSIVESSTLRCTHFDAYRFFTKEAKPRNFNFMPSISLLRANQSINEQPGCVHTNMDLFKWSIKLFPYISSELIADSLELAIEARIVDMKASPYDLTQYQPPDGMDIGFNPTPILIESYEGRKEYQRCQERLYRKSQPIRLELIQFYEEMLKVTTDITNTTISNTSTNHPDMNIIPSVVHGNT